MSLQLSVIYSTVKAHILQFFFIMLPRSEVKISGGMCVLSLIYSHVVCMWVTV
jgi:hypothetical protein